MNPSKFIYNLKENKRFTSKNISVKVDKNKTKNEMRVKNVVICGSMAFYDVMLRISEKLKKSGIPIVLPKEESEEKESLSKEEFSDFKKRVSSQYLSKIRENSTYGILVVNQEKKGLDNYIGANTLVEISMAFCWGRPIYLYNDFYEPIKEELLAWQVISLQGNLDRLIEEYKKARYVLNDKFTLSSDDGQLELGDIDEYFYPLLR